MKICITNSTDHKYILYKIKLYKVALEYRQSFVQNFKFYVLPFHITRVYAQSQTRFLLRLGLGCIEISSSCRYFSPVQADIFSLGSCFLYCSSPLFWYFVSLRLASPSKPFSSVSQLDKCTYIRTRMCPCVQVIRHIYEGCPKMPYNSIILLEFKTNFS